MADVNIFELKLDELIKQRTDEVIDMLKKHKEMNPGLSEDILTEKKRVVRKRSKALE